MQTKLSRYCKIYRDDHDPSSVILFSTKTASKVSIPESMLEDIRTGPLSEEETAELSELGFLIDSLDEERGAIHGFIDELNSEDSVFSAKLVMNLDCNLDCGYCFEGSRKGRHYMTEETAADCIRFIKKNITPGLKELGITFYGGEPLLSRDLIAAISSEIKIVAETAGLKYTGSLITNGTLLIPEVANAMSTAGVGSASITLDGPAYIHDKSRPFKNGGGSFGAIMKNLKGIAGLIDIDLSGNFTRNNYRRFPELFDLLSDEGLTPEDISSFQFYPVLQEAEGIANCHFREGCSSVNEPWLFEAEIFLREEIMKRGYRTSKIIPTACMMELKNRLIVNHDGSIYKCSGLLGRKEFKVGDIWSGIHDHRTSNNLDNWKNEECLSCEYLPLCFGGCRYMKYIRDNNMDVDCKKPYLDATLEAMVKQDIQYTANPY
ncbi:MAG: putative geopeptide radical SAM maturase [Thermodesulfovibrio sp.]|nr:putative geopeptide radical SAM maturase [Thermodesulfovibrio sp.]